MVSLSFSHHLKFLCVAALTLLSYFQFPGHTYLQADTQIYIPILEHLWDPAVLADDLLVQKPHVSFTLYDEAAAALLRHEYQTLRDIDAPGVVKALALEERSGHAALILEDAACDGAAP